MNLKTILVQKQTLICTWVILLTLVFVLLLLYLPSVSCTSVTGPRFCIPQYKVRFLDVLDEDRNLLQGLKDLLQLLSYVAVDLSSSSSMPATEDYDSINLVNTFDASNTFKINYLGFCKQQLTRSKIPAYCSNNRNGLEPVSALVRDVGIQFGIVASKNPHIMGESFVYVFKMGLSTLLASPEDFPGKESAISKYLSTRATNGGESLKSAGETFHRLEELAYWLSMMQRFCWTLGWAGLIEFFLCVIILISLLLAAPANLFGKWRKHMSWFEAMGTLLLKSLPILVLLVSFFDLLFSATWYISLKKASSHYGLTHKFYDLKLGEGFYINVCRLFFQCVILFQALRFTRNITLEVHSDEEHTEIGSPQKDLEAGSVLSSGTTV
ncbi:Sma2p [Lachancea thermotolerans CBS 6340]|uniref:KLTH0D16302p n=1 Tax=Lachancea thermotolerans (strain ATCC 56472 / CBS 6340 / NRRL Y-8284) TaxID=559295 RepID=C5DFM4_LACTC|nr:KLTH0D16302p [Lachancea thermotolerans CBS 6340]CAR22979.1 KLTH0D16302p [Lachancea thermotolerans CBS 6340]